MRPTLAAAAVLVLAAGAVSVRAQEATPAPAAEEQDQDNGREAARRHIQVLQHPYDISSFYRSAPSSGQGAFGYDAGVGADERYPLAGFYRAGGGHGRYSMFWTTGYGNSYANGRRPGSGNGRGTRGRGFLGASRSRALGLNGDLCLFAPTFLAPVGPLTGVFFDR
jgi:hypothetical protein